MELSHDALDEGNGYAVVIKNPFLGFGVPLTKCLASSLPPVHEMIGREHISKQIFGIAAKFAKNLRGKFVVLLAERCDPGLEREWCPVNQMVREGYEFFSRSSSS